MQATNRLLIIRFSALGDVAMLVPVVQRLAQAYPDWHITMLSRKQVAPLFADMPANVRFVGADLKGEHRGIKGLNRLLHEINYRQFNKIADMHNVLRSKYIRLRMPCTRKAHIHKGRIAKWWLCQPCNRHKHPLRSTWQRYADVLLRLGFILAPTEPEKTSSTHRKGIGIAPFAAHKGKVYPLDKMEEVVRLLSGQGEHVYLFGAGEKEETVLKQWQEKYPGVESMVGRYTLAEEIKFMQHLRLMLTMDSANMHLASLAGTRVISIWGATHPAAGFLGHGQSEQDCIQRDIPCRPCSIYGNQPCKYGDYRCLNIPPHEIVKHLTETTCK